MFNVLFIVTIWDGTESRNATRFAEMIRAEVLPFPPSTLIEFTVGGGYAEAPVRLTWNSEQQRFIAKMADRYIDPDVDSWIPETFESLITDAEKAGYTKSYVKEVLIKVAGS